MDCYPVPELLPYVYKFESYLCFEMNVLALSMRDEWLLCVLGLILHLYYCIYIWISEHRLFHCTALTDWSV
jgi:hypothetical protein